MYRLINTVILVLVYCINFHFKLNSTFDILNSTFDILWAMSANTTNISKLQRKIETLENCIVSLKKHYTQSLIEYQKYQNEVSQQDLVDMVMFMDKSKQISAIQLQSLSKQILIDVIKHAIQTNANEAIELIKKHL